MPSRRVKLVLPALRFLGFPLLFKIKASHVERLVNAECNPGTIAVASPSVVEVEVLAQFAVHENVGDADKCRQDMAVEAIGNDEAR